MPWSETADSSNDPSADDRAARQLAERVAAMRLTGAISLIIAEPEAVWDTPGGDQAGLIARKLALLAAHEHLTVVIPGQLGDDQRRDLAVAGSAASAGERIIVADADPRASVTELVRHHGTTIQECLVLLAGADRAVPSGCLAFHVGPGEPPPNAHATHLPGAHATDQILGLYGTALAQERAGQAFRAASIGGSPPAEADFDRGILEGIVRSGGRPDPPSPAPYRALPDHDGLRDLARRAFGHLCRNLLPSGAVVGAPVRGQRPGEPNYWFHWQRDGAAAMSWLLEWYQRGYPGLDSSELADHIARYFGFLERAQSHGHLGTSRYTVAGEPIQGFGNPQWDGLALTALALARVEDPARVWERLQVALDALAAPEAGGAGVDAWEFIYGHHFNVTVLQARALGAGAGVAARLGHAAAAAHYAAAAERLSGMLASYVDARTGRVVAHRAPVVPWFEAISRLDMAAVAALLAAWPVSPHDPAAVGRDLTSLAHPAILNTMADLEDTFASLYQANRDWRAGGNAGFGLGRFPEDANDGVGSTGGDPWPLTTLWGAQFYYRLAQELDDALRAAPARARLTDQRQADFMSRVASEEIVARDWPIEPSVWHGRLLPALLARGDGYLNFVVHHVPLDGGVTEQIDRATGQPRGAPCLSWALAELIGTIQIREGALGLVERAG